MKPDAPLSADGQCVLCVRDICRPLTFEIVLLSDHHGFVRAGGLHFPLTEKQTAVAFFRAVLGSLYVLEAGGLSCLG